MSETSQNKVQIHNFGQIHNKMAAPSNGRIGKFKENRFLTLLQCVSKYIITINIHRYSSR